jgi:hypothetical protein
MKHRRSINKIKKYTAFVPKTMRATKVLGRSMVNRMNYFLNKTNKTIKNTAKYIDRKTAKSIRSFTKRRARK